MKPSQTPWQRTMWVLFIIQLLTAAGFSSIFPFLPFYVEELGSSTGMSVELLSGLVFSLQGFSMMIASPVWGSLADRFGRKIMIQRATFGGALMMLAMALVQSAEQLVVIRMLQGALTGVVSANSALLASVAPRERSGYAMGMLQVALGTGLAVGPVLGGLMADSFGYRPAFYITAGLMLVGALLVTFLVHENFIPDTSNTGARAVARGWRLVLGRPGVGVTYLMRFMGRASRMLFIPIAPFFIATLVTDSSLMNTYVGWAISLPALATTVSAGYLGRLGDRIGHRKVLVASLLLAGLLFLPQARVATVWQLLAMLGLSGIAMGGVIPAISALLAQYTLPGEEGAAYGLDNSVGAAGNAVAPAFGGLLAGRFGNGSVFTATGLLLLAAAAIAAATLPHPVRQAAAPPVPLAE